MNRGFPSDETPLWIICPFCGDYSSWEALYQMDEDSLVELCRGEFHCAECSRDWVMEWKPLVKVDSESCKG